MHVVSVSCRWSIVLILFVTLTAVAGPAFASMPSWPHEGSDLKPDPALLFGSLENGFRYVLMENHEPKNRVSMKLLVEAGSLNETEEQKGYAHFLEHMLFNGTTHFPPGELIEYFQRIGMGFGNDLNAHTGFNSTVYQLLLPEPDPDSLDKALTVMADYAAGALLLPEEIEKEKGVVLAEKKDRDSVSYRTFVDTFQFLLPETLVSRRMPIGEEDIIRGIDHKSLKDFYTSWYRPDNIILVAVGDFATKDLMELIPKHFRGIEAKSPTRPDPSPGTFVHKGFKALYHYEKDAGNTEVSLETARVVPKEKDGFARQKRFLLQRLANAIVSNRLERMKAKPDCPFTSASIHSGVFLETIAFSSISADCAPEKWEAALAAIESSLRQAFEHGFLDSEVERVRKETLAGMESAVLKAKTRNSDHLASVIVSNLSANEVFLSPEEELERFGPVVREADKETLHKEFKSVWPEDHRLVEVTGNVVIEDADSPENKIMGAYRASLAVPVSRIEEEKKTSFPYLDGKRVPASVVKEERIEDLGIVRREYANKVVLFYKKTDFKENEVLANVLFGSGRCQEPKDKPGLSFLTSSVVNESGVGALKQEDLLEALAGENTSLRFSVRGDGFIYKGITTTKSLPTLMELFYTYIVDPALREDAYSLAQRRYEQKYNTMVHSVEGGVALWGDRFLASDDGRFGFPELSDYKKLTLEDIRNYLGPALEAAPLELTVVGDFDEKELVRLADITLGSLPPRTGKPGSARDLTIHFPSGESASFEVETEIDKAYIITAYPTNDIWDISKTRRNAILAEVISEKMRTDVRELLGITYSPGAWNHPSRVYPGYGLLKAFVSVEPSMLDKAKDAIFTIMKDLREKGVDEDILNRSKEPVVTGIKDLLRKNDYWLDTVLAGASRHPEQIDWCRTILPDYESITRKEIESLAKTTLPDEKAAVLIVKPKEPKKARKTDS